MDRAGGRLDAYAHHPYPLRPAETPSSGWVRALRTVTLATLERLLTAVSRAFPSARVWLTEYGYQTNPPDRLLGVSPAKQAPYLAEAARRVATLPRVDLLIHYLYRDEPSLGRWQSGLTTVTGQAKPALAAAMLPLAQVSRKGSSTVVWGQVATRFRATAIRAPDSPWQPLDGGRRRPHDRTRRHAGPDRDGPRRLAVAALVPGPPHRWACVDCALTLP